MLHKQRNSILRISNYEEWVLPRCLDRKSTSGWRNPVGKNKLGDRGDLFFCIKHAFELR